MPLLHANPALALDTRPDGTAAPRRPRDWLPYAIAVLVLGLLLVLLAAVSIWQERLRQRERAVAGTQNIARLLEAHVSDVLSKADVLLQASALQWRSIGPRDGSAAAAATLQPLTGAVPGLLNLRVADAQGHLLLGGAGAGPAVLGGADLELLQRLRDDPGAGLLISGPLQRAPGQPWVLGLARALQRPEGGFGGMVSVDLAVTRFDALFSAIDLGEHGAATIRTRELALVYRRPWPREGIGAAIGRSDVSAELRAAVAANPRDGDYVAPTAIDGISRINVYRQVGNHPLILLVGLPESDFPQGWNAVDSSVVTLALVTLGVAGVAAGVLLRLQRRALGVARRRLAAIVESSPDAIVSEGHDGRITSWNSGAERLFGWTAAEMIGQPLDRLMPPERRDEARALAEKVLRGSPVAQLETERITKDGRRLAVSVSMAPLFDADGRIVGSARIARDISAQKALAEEVRQLAFHDPLTRLPNRRLLMDRLAQAQLTSRRLNRHAALLFVDLDGFKAINDRHGHEFGDQWLQLVARRLGEAVRESDTVARLGGDEFVLVCENLDADPPAAEAAVQALAEKIETALAQPAQLAGVQVQAGASVGWQLFLGAEPAPEPLLAAADAAMYRRKQQRRPPPAADEHGPQEGPAPQASDDEDDSDFGPL